MTETDRRRSVRLVTMSDVRIILVGGGIFLAAIGGIVVSNDIRPSDYPAIVFWLAGAIIVHDVLISGLVFAVAFAGRRAAARGPLRMILLVQCALAVGAITALLVLPEVIGKAAGSAANPSILPLDYGVNLAILLGILTVAVIGGIALHVVSDRIRRSRTVSR